MMCMQELNTDIAALDLRTLRFLKQILATASVTKTSMHLGISQPAASRILARIRDLIGDPILIRTSSGYQLTDHALSLKAPLEEAIKAVSDVFAPSRFDPGQSRYRFRIASTDYGVAAVLGPLVEVFARNAPSLRVDVSPLVPKSFHDLRTGDIDLMLYADLDIDEDFIAQKLYEETYEILFREGHPLEAVSREKPALTPDDLSAYRLIEFSFPDAVQLKPDTIMRSESDGSNTLFQQPYFTTLPFLVAQGDAVAVLPGRLSQQVKRVTTLRTARFQADESFPYHLVRHERSRHNPAISWFVEQAKDLHQAVGTAAPGR